jgi:hypothetical protein
MATIDDLKKKTIEFLIKHYIKSPQSKFPEWSPVWEFKDTIPEYDKRGCYALLNNSNVEYIGVAIGISNEKTKDSGIGYRLKNYWKVKERGSSNDLKLYKPSPHINWTFSGIITLGFEDQEYLAAALEVFLIQSLNPPKNIKLKRQT